MLYTSVDNKKIKDIKKLNTKRYRDKKGLFLVEGKHLVLEAFKMKYLETLIIEKDEIFPLNVDTMYVTNNVLNYISNLETPQTIMGICRKKNDHFIGNKILVLDDVQDPGNLGTIIRSAVAFNIDTIVLSKNTVDLYNPKVIRATQGLVFHINIIEEELESFIIELKMKNYKIFGTRVTHGKELKSLEKSEKFVIIVGNEGNGLSDKMIELSDEYIYITMNSTCESLNVGVATSIILYEFDK